MIDLSVKDENRRLNLRVGVVLKCNGRYLLHKHQKQGFWTVPGGRIQFGETVLDSAKREMMEELEIENIELKTVCAVENFYTVGDANSHEFLFICKGKIPTKMYEKFINFKIIDNPDFVTNWFSLDEILNEKLNLKPIVLREILKNEKTAKNKVVLTEK